MTNIQVPQSLLTFIREGSKFLIAGHKEPDGDCVGSQLALCSVLNRLGKQAIPCSAGPFKRPEIVSYAEGFTSTPPREPESRVIVMDCSSLERTGDLEPYIMGLPLAIIDHHAAAKPTGDVIFLEPTSPSVTALTLLLIEALGLTPTKEEAELLFFGLCTDTGFFRHVDYGGAFTFDIASRLISAGASPKRTFQKINGGKSLESRILLGLILSRTESYYHGKLLVSYENLEDTERFGLQGRDSDMLYQLLLSVAGVEAVAVIRQESPTSCTVGLRSIDKVDVSAIAVQFGGGGHKQASGFTAQGTIAPLKERLIRAFAEVL
ncbi:DHH family phosphoesterase [Gracilinema caldarium]|uniref:Phosphoesterase RecJ domain protein n=1 Tax=Gracilinema caldarium (strain ATCC 51460 / DSM 7334 / H1) TaxID=744872 RepID=F8EZ15_GRAC1|nr:bifunctional oligoribonuclease/PAP phosphatase NrnA [Gracilinema caldarium]AEJ19246.1 phosphoesterase RecJ domain protein [Gracilinema caldarium DSM 7334]